MGFGTAGKCISCRFGSGTAGKCMLDFVCYFPKVEIYGLSLDYWPGMTSLCELFWCVIVGN